MLETLAAASPAARASISTADTAAGTLPAAGLRSTPGCGCESPATGAPASRSRRRRPGREAESEDGAAAALARARFDRAAEALHGGVAQSKTKTGALAGGRGGEERLAQSGRRFAGQSAAGVDP